jgi:hypothetical protein
MTDRILFLLLLATTAFIAMGCSADLIAEENANDDKESRNRASATHRGQGDGSPWGGRGHNRPVNVGKARARANDH